MPLAPLTSLFAEVVLRGDKGLTLLKSQLSSLFPIPRVAVQSMGRVLPGSQQDSPLRATGLAQMTVFLLLQ